MQKPRPLRSGRDQQGIIWLALHRSNAGLIGLHNAAVKPNGVLKANQAIRFDRIHERIQPALGNQPLPGRIRPWKIDEADGQLVPIIGRDRLIDWMMHALGTDRPALRRRDRVFATYPLRDDATGLSFAAEIAEAMLAGEERNRSLTIGGDTLRLPERAEDLGF